MELIEETKEENENEPVVELRGLERCLQLGMTHFTSYSEIPENLQKRYHEFIFPPTPEEAKWMHLG